MQVPQSKFRLVWRELLSSAEIVDWVLHRKTPQRIRSGDFSEPGVYRFVFPEAVDGKARHTPCYVGEGGNVGRRLRVHFAPPKEGLSRLLSGEISLKPGWPVRGNIQNSQGQFILQSLTVEGSISIDGILINQDSFDSPFSRRLLENLAILHSERFDKFRQLNRGIPETSKNLFVGLKQSRARRRVSGFQAVRGVDLSVQENGK